ncbi:hypothetical protein K438DRAFT_1748025 [Mycena galopus ATCC 62051]|nr:hypothetical protein K438DRAFT_1748025 [Mycena galopus ATCC 62051]
MSARLVKLTSSGRPCYWHKISPSLVSRRAGVSESALCLKSPPGIMMDLDSLLGFSFRYYWGLYSGLASTPSEITTEPEICSIHAWCAHKTSPPTTSPVVLRAECANQIASAALRLQFDEFGEVKFLKEGAVVPEIQPANDTVHDDLCDSDLWTVKAEERPAKHDRQDETREARRRDGSPSPKKYAEKGEKCRSAPLLTRKYISKKGTSCNKGLVSHISVTLRTLESDHWAQTQAVIGGDAAFSNATSGACESNIRHAVDVDTQIYARVFDTDDHDERKSGSRMYEPFPPSTTKSITPAHPYFEFELHIPQETAVDFVSYYTTVEKSSRPPLHDVVLPKSRQRAPRRRHRRPPSSTTSRQEPPRHSSLRSGAQAEIPDAFPVMQPVFTAEALVNTSARLMQPGTWVNRSLPTGHEHDSVADAVSGSPPG